MRKIRTAVLAGAAAIAAAGAAMAATHDTHYLNVAMPDGTTARIEYHGDVAPKVIVAPAGSPAFQAGLVDAFDMAPLAMFDRIAAQMDRQAEMLMRRAASLPSEPVQPDGRLNVAAFGKLPAGTVSYSFVSMSTRNGTCSRSVELTSLGPNQPPKLISNRSGDCTNEPKAARPAVDRQSEPPAALTTVSVKAPIGEAKVSPPATT